jgi:hypothetical protein
MHGSEGWYRIALVVYGVAVLVHGLWRSRGPAEPDAIRPSGPIL